MSDVLVLRYLINSLRLMFSALEWEQLVCMWETLPNINSESWLSQAPRYDNGNRNVSVAKEANSDSSWVSSDHCDQTQGADP